MQGGIHRYIIALFLPQMLTMGCQDLEIGKIRPLQKHSDLLQIIKNDIDIIFIYRTAQNESI
jgi:hypothetical protein